MAPDLVPLAATAGPTLLLGKQQVAQQPAPQSGLDIFGAQPAPQATAQTMSTQGPVNEVGALFATQPSASAMGN